MSVRKELRLPEDIAREMQKDADICCGGNLSEAFRKWWRLSRTGERQDMKIIGDIVRNELRTALNMERKFTDFILCERLGLNKKK